MACILVYEADKIYQAMIGHALKSEGHELIFISDGSQWIAQTSGITPNLIIFDVMLPNEDGYAAVRRLREESIFAQLPILLLISQSNLEEKLSGFDSGADDYLVKPFVPQELAEHVRNLLRKADAGQQEVTKSEAGKSHVIAVHNLRGGIGNTTLAVNLAVALYGLWNRPTILLDLVLTSGQVALMFNTALRHSWADIAANTPEAIDIYTLHSIVHHHDSGIDFIAAPSFPPDADLLTPKHYEACFNLLRKTYDYIVVDLPHDFREIAYTTLDVADEILVVTSPEMVSVRAAAAALETYKKLGYNMEKVRLILNWTFEKNGLVKKNIEAALHHPVRVTLPFVPWITVDAINFGQPFLQNKPMEAISILIENLAFNVSKEEDRLSKPVNPTKAWKRTIKRLKK